jgi:hypothetical protein
MLFGESPHNYHRTGSSGSNLTYEGLLLRMHVGGHGDPQTRASLSKVNHSEPSFYDDTCDTPSYFFAMEVDYTAGLQPSRGQGEARSDGGLSA